MANSVELLIFKLHSQKINNEIPILSRSIYQGLIDKYKPILEKNKKKLTKHHHKEIQEFLDKIPSDACEMRLMIYLKRIPV